VSPSALAVFKFRTVSYLVGTCTTMARPSPLIRWRRCANCYCRTPNSNSIAHPMITRHFHALPVAASLLKVQGIDGLLGRDVLRECLFIYIGPDKIPMRHAFASASCRHTAALARGSSVPQKPTYAAQGWVGELA
jgi:hypothetical protein